MPPQARHAGRAVALADCPLVGAAGLRFGSADSTGGYRIYLFARWQLRGQAELFRQSAKSAWLRDRVAAPHGVRFSEHQDRAATKKYALSFDLAKSAVVVSAEDRTRLIINLNETAGYDLSRQGNSIAIVVGDKQGNAAARDRFASAAGGSVTTDPGSDLTAIDFQRGEDGEG